MGKKGGHGRAGGKRNQSVGGGSNESKREFRVAGKKSQLGLPQLGDFKGKMERMMHKQRRRNNVAVKRLEKVQADSAARRAKLGIDEYGNVIDDGMNYQRGHMAALMLNAQQSADHYASRADFLESTVNPDNLAEYNTNRSRENSKRRFWKEFQKVVKASDVILEVLDARDPLGCRLREIEQTIESQFDGRKQFVLILNKVDLVPKENIMAWLDYFRVEGLPVVAFSAAGGGKVASQETSGSKSHDDASHRCIHHLYDTLKKFQRTEGGGKKHITVGIVGFPNVGKSSIINALKRKTVVGVGNTPGHTTSAQEVALQHGVRILDCPGVVMSEANDAETALRNAMKIEHLDDCITPVELIVKRCTMERLEMVYRLPPSLGSFNTFIYNLASKKGKLLRGGKPNIDDTCRVVLKDWNDGRIHFYTMPPHDRDFVAMENPVTLTNAEVEGEATILNQLSSKASDFVQILAKKAPEPTTYAMDMSRAGARNGQEESSDDDDDMEMEEDWEGGDGDDMDMEGGGLRQRNARNPFEMIEDDDDDDDDDVEDDQPHHSDPAGGFLADPAQGDDYAANVGVNSAFRGEGTGIIGNDLDDDDEAPVDEAQQELDERRRKKKVVRRVVKVRKVKKSGGAAGGEEEMA